MPSSKELPLDLRDAAVWLESQGMVGPLEVDRNYVPDERLISHVVVYNDVPEVRRTLRLQATRALEALGYRVEPTGGDVYSVSAARRHGLTVQQKNRMVSRIELALSGKSFGPPEITDPPPRRMTPEEIAALPVDDDF
ncbi:hypothetical protein [Antarctobacter jejuensis]|uniref:hypothetical protein n=1 Tax=Antarctobacter jejuensis TaxID=1439938 RepID=UPI003FD26F90